MGTVVVSGTAGFVWQFDRPTLGVSVRHPTFPTGANHGSEGKTVDHCADGCNVTRRQGHTRVLASLVQTGGVVRTVAINVTLWLRFWHHGELLGSTGD